MFHVSVYSQCCQSVSPSINGLQHDKMAFTILFTCIFVLLFSVDTHVIQTEEKTWLRLFFLLQFKNLGNSLAAIEAVKNEEPLLRAAVTFGIPRTTLGDRMRGKVVHGTKCGPRPYLSPDEKLKLSDFIVEVGQAKNVVRDKGMLRGSRVTSGWFRRFMERHPDLSLRKGDVTANVRMDCLNSETMKAYFDLLKDSPAQIYYIEASSQINQQILCGQTISKCIFTRVYSKSQT